MDQYIFEALTQNKKGKLYSIPFSKKKEALDQYKHLCEIYPKEHFRVIKRQIIEDTIAESDDFRQTKFSF